MENTLFSFIWKYSKRQQFVLLAVTLATFPFLYASLELPKRIINDAIGAESAQIDLWDFSFTQVEYLLILCLAFLAAVLVSGLMKMRLNTMKGILSERMLRRFRYQLISRMLRFPRPYFRSTSQGELVAMVTSEAEPMGGLMGDAVAQPVFLAGQMLTILTFLFIQSVWFGLAAVALIPLQAWLIPMLQRQINQLNKKRIIEVRHLASEIGESAAGISDLRVNGGWRYRLSEISERLGRLFEIRFKIYQKKFFMKFINNFITQLTPFFFYLVGGYLAIRGEITVGALVAAIAAYKDIASPWKELLDYYNQVQDMSLRWQTVTERFDPKGTLDEKLFEGEPADIPHLRGTISIKDVTVRDADGNTVLEDITLDIPPGARVAIQSRSDAERAAFAELLTREVIPSRGSVTIAGHDLMGLHQMVLSARIGHAHSRPYLFEGTLGDNLLMPLRIKPMAGGADSRRRNRRRLESQLSGNSTDPLDADWVDPGLAGLTDGEDIRDWWFTLVEAMGIDEMMFRRTLRSQFDPAKHQVLARRIVGLRPLVRERLREAGLDQLVHRFAPDQFNPGIPLGGNLLYATPLREISQEGLAAEGRFLTILAENKLADDAQTIAIAVIQTLRKTFGRDGTDHPLFRRLGIAEETYRRLTQIAEAMEVGARARVPDADRALLLTVPFLLSAEQIGPAFPEEYKKKILQIRRDKAPLLRRLMGDQFVAVDEDAYLPRLSALENALFGKVSMMAGSRAEEIEGLVAKAFEEAGLRRLMAEIIYDMPTGLGGANLPAVLHERAAFSRAGIKRPDILILDKALASHDSDSRSRTRDKLRNLLPKTTMIFMEDSFAHPARYDLYIEIRNGRIDGVRDGHDDAGTAGGDDLRRKQRLIAQTALFGNLDARNQRLLAFSAQWFDARAGEVIFRAGEKADAAYLCLDGQAEMHWPEKGLGSRPIASIGPGRVIGDLSIILREARQLNLISVTDTKWLRIGAEEYLAVVENDPSVALGLLQTVAGHLNGAAALLRNARLGADVSSDGSLEALER